MDELFAWINRLGKLQADSPVTERFYRVSAPSNLHFEAGPIRLSGTSEEVVPFGSLATPLSILSFLDDGTRTPSVSDTSVATQLGALLTLASNRRVQVASTDVQVQMEGTTQRTFLPSELADRSLIGPTPNQLGIELVAIIDRTLALAKGGPERRAVERAIELHYVAVILCGTDPSAAYALVVAGLEVLSRTFGDAPADWGSWEDSARLDLLFNEVALTEAQASRIRAALIENKGIRLRQVFAAYIVGALPDSFWTETMEDFVPQVVMGQDGRARSQGVKPGPPLPPQNFVPRDRADLRKRLLRSYDRRSSFVHAGERPLPYTDLAPLVGLETDGAISFRGLRSILRTLILQHLPPAPPSTSLPDVQLRHGPAR